MNVKTFVQAIAKENYRKHLHECADLARRLDEDEGLNPEEIVGLFLAIGIAVAKTSAGGCSKASFLAMALGVWDDPISS